MELGARRAKAGGVCRDLRAGRGRGFTLVELLIVIGIAAIMMAIIVPSYVSLARQNKRHSCISKLKAIGQALAIFHEDYGCYPPDQTEYLWTPEAVQEYERLYNEEPPGDHRFGSLVGAAYHPNGSPFAPDPSYFYYKDPSQAMHGLGLLTLYYLGAYSSVLPPLSTEPRITADMRSGAVKVEGFDRHGGYNQKFFTWYRGSGYLMQPSAFHCPENGAPLDQKAIQDPTRIPGFTDVATFLADGTLNPQAKYWNNYDQFYRRNFFWKELIPGVPGSQPPSLDNLSEADRMANSLAGATRNLCVPYPPADTVITWCPYHHRGYIPRWPGDDPTATDPASTKKIRDGDMDMVLLVDGSVRRVLARQDAKMYDAPPGDTSWPSTQPVM